MHNSLALGELPCELSLNGVRMRSVKIRLSAQSGDDFDIVVTDFLLGSFSLHFGFDIEVRECDAAWRRVSLEELKTVLKSRYVLSGGDLTTESQIAGSRLFAPVNDIEIPEWQCGRFSALGREAACVRYVQRILYRTGIPHLVSGTTFLVRSATTARIPLKRAGFCQSKISPSALVEPRTGCAIQVIERDPQG